MLKVSGVHTFYGAIEALKGVDIEIGAGEIERHLDLTRFAALDQRAVEGARHARFAAMAEVQPVSFLQALRRPRERAPAIRRKALDQHQRHVGRKLAAQAHAADRRRDHACIVEDERVALPQQRRQITHAPILERRIGRRNDEQARAVPRGGGMQRDAVLGQGKVEQVGTHRAGLVAFDRGAEAGAIYGISQAF